MQRYPAGEDQNCAQRPVVSERGVQGQRSALRETAQNQFFGRQPRPGQLLVQERVHFVHGAQYVRLVFRRILVQRRHVKPRRDRESFVQRQRYLGAESVSKQIVSRTHAHAHVCRYFYCRVHILMLS